MPLAWQDLLHAERVLRKSEKVEVYFLLCRAA